MEAEVDAIIVGSGKESDGDDASIVELTSLLLARRNEAKKTGDAP